MDGEPSTPPRRAKFTTDTDSYGKRSQSRRTASTEGDYESGTEQAYSPRSATPEEGFQRGRRPRSPPPESIRSLESAPPIPYWSAKRHLTCGNPTPGPPWSQKPQPWRGSAPGRLKTAAAALVMCLNIDVDPPDVVKTNPCAVFECWVDPRTMPTHKALEHIGSNLQHQFESLSTKIQYKPILDPSFEDLKRFVGQLRRQAGTDALLFYYNGHGVPKPTASGELWCFNRNYTQYIPVSLQELQTWVGSPGVYIWDCSAAGHLLQNFNTFAERRDQEATLHPGQAEKHQPFMNSLQLAACGANETLPSCPELPADVFTSCLTSPIDIALRYYIMCHQLPGQITADMVTQLPGDLRDRRTPLGELNWIFTAITDTIAWTTFSREIFTKLYRSDLLIASLFRNFLLAERIMKNYHCTPHTCPPLPSTNTHPLWATWDLAVDTCIRQLPELMWKGGVGGGLGSHVANVGTAPGRIGQTSKQDPSPTQASDKPYVYQPSRFFSDQLTAFEVWISRGGSALTRKGAHSLPQATEKSETGSPIEPTHRSDYDGLPSHLVPRKPPDQLPIVLQVLLSQPHRLRALILLSQFVDLGPWAVHLVLTIGIFPYISKLLQAAGQDLRPVLIFIWARILAVDPSVQHDLFNTGGYKYFSSVLAIKNDDVLPNSSEHKAMCAFILAAISRDFPHGQGACWAENVFDNCYDRLDEGDFLLRQWAALCIGQMWDGNDELKVFGVDNGTQDKLIAMLSDDSAEVRCAALFSLGTFLGASGSADPSKQGGGGSGTMYQLDERVHFRMEVAVVTGATLAIKDDGSPMCRKELLVVISALVKEWRGCFVICAWLYWEEDRRWRKHGAPQSAEDEITSHAVAQWLDGFDDEGLREEKRVLLSSFFTIFVVLLDLSVDPYPEVASNAQTIVDYIMALLLESPFTKLPSSTLHAAPSCPEDLKTPLQPSNHRPPKINVYGTSPYPSSPSLSSSRPSLSRADTGGTITSLTAGVSNTLRRTSSFANALKSLANGIAFPSADGDSTPKTPVTATPLRREIIDISRPPSPNLNVAQYASPYSQPTSPPGTPGGHRRQPSQESYLVPVQFTASDVMEALTEEDIERLRARRRLGGNGRGRHGGMPSPSNSTFSTDSSSSVTLGLGTGANIRDTLPLKSSYFDWCCEYFKEPQMRQAEADEPGSIQYNHQVWRQQRNDQAINEVNTQKYVAQTCRWDKPVASFQITGHPLTMRFHSFDQQVVIANENDMISVWDWSARRRLNYFCNGNPRGTSVTSLEIINQDVGGIILTGASDGIVRLYRNYDPTLEQGPLQMVSAFKALNEIVQTRQGSGMVMDWKQLAGTLLVGGDSRVIKTWDAQTENQGMDLDTNSDSPVTAISTDAFNHHVFIASFADGGIKVFDRRLEDDDAIVRNYVDHTSLVQNVRWHHLYGNTFLSASIDGSVKVWDMRGADIAAKSWDIQPHGLAAFDAHTQTGVFASSSAISPTHWKTQRVSVHSTDRGMNLSSATISTGLASFPIRPLPSPSIPRSSSLVFHPIEMLYGIGEPDGTIRVMGCKFPPPE